MCVGSSEQEIYLLFEMQQMLEAFHQLSKLEQLQPEGRKGKPITVIDNELEWRLWQVSEIICVYINEIYLILYFLPSNRY